MLSCLTNWAIYQKIRKFTFHLTGADTGNFKNRLGRELGYPDSITGKTKANSK